MGKFLGVLKQLQGLKGVFSTGFEKSYLGVTILPTCPNEWQDRPAGPDREACGQPFVAWFRFTVQVAAILGGAVVQESGNIP